MSSDSETDEAGGLGGAPSAAPAAKATGKGKAKKLKGAPASDAALAAQAATRGNAALRSAARAAYLLRGVHPMAAADKAALPPWHSAPCCIGIDEAGRGPVLGPMTYGAAWCPVARRVDLKKTDINDSKQLSGDQRERLLALMHTLDYVRYEIDVISAADISARMLQRNKYSLNALSHDSAIALVRSIIGQGYNVTELYVDTVGDPERYEARLSQLFPGVQCVVRKKADAIYRIVGAASIAAKVVRDHCVEAWRSCFTPAELLWAGELGSGYPGDDRTKEWLSKNCEDVFGFPSFVRFSWSTASKMMAERCVQTTYGPDSDDEDGDPLKGTGGIMRFMGAKAPAKAPADGEPCAKRSKVKQRRTAKWLRDRKIELGGGGL